MPDLPVLMVRVTVPPSEAAIKKGGVARGKFRVLYGLEGRPEYRFTAPTLQAAKLLRRGVLAAVKGRLVSGEKGEEEVSVDFVDEVRFGPDEFCALPTRQALEEIADATGVYMSFEEYASCLAALGSTGLGFCGREDYERLAAAVGDELADRFMRLAGWERKWGADMLEGLFAFCGLAGSVDSTLIWQVAKALRFRASRRKVSVFDLVAEHPYILVQVWENTRFAFKVAETIWERLRGPLSSPAHLVEKAAAAAVGCVKDEMNRGHSFAWKNVVSAKMFEALGAAASGGTVAEGWRFVASEAGRKLYGGLQTENDGTRISLRQVAVDSGRYPREKWDPEKDKAEPAAYAPGIYWSERRAAEALAKFSVMPAGMWLDEAVLLRAAQEAAQRDGGGLDREQEMFVRAAASSKVTVLTGEAGTGKTQALKWLCGAVKQVVPGYVPLVLAPTGIAAYRAAEKIAGVGMTVHRYAAIFEEDADVFVDMEGASEGDGGAEAPGLLVVDECSMLGPVVLRRLLSRVSPLTKVVLAGDPEQLAPVGPAGVFHALVRLAAGQAPGFALTQLVVNHRAARGSGVYQGAREIRDGRPLPEGLPGIEVRLASKPEQAPEACLSAVEEITGGCWPEEPGELMVLTSYRERSPASVDRLNALLERRFGAPSPDGVPAPGTPVICRRNDYADGGGMAPKEIRAYRHPERKTNVFNGTPGVVAEVRKNGAIEVRVRYRMGEAYLDAWYSLREFSYWVDKAYATTVHKAQGGQARNVVVVLGTPGSLKNRRLIYTALSRCYDEPPGSGRVVIVACQEFARAPYAQKSLREELTGGVLCGLYYRALAELRRMPAATPPSPEVTNQVPEWWA
jgi:exodeoxyribonuclease V alpha subunit